MRARRGLLYIPGDDLRKITKGTTLGVDCVCLDMEDGVAANRKAEARTVIQAALRDLDFGTSERLVRINAMGTGLEEEDLDAVLGSGPGVRPDGIVLPKAESAEEVRHISARIAQAEARYGWKPGGISLIILIETALGLVDMRSILTADPRLEAVIFGAEDLAGSIGMIRTKGCLELLYARSALVTHAAAFGLQAIDMVHSDFRDLEGLRIACLEGASLGFSGKQLVHPGQVVPAQEAFTPSKEAIADARRLVDAFEAQQRAGRGAFDFGGIMVDMPILRTARGVLERARAAGRETGAAK
ncbi:MAG: HpcH/HpaI aldolase/citrate lyase family protein [Rectinemataceae bacterium]